MRATIRWAACLAMAMAAGGAFAGDSTADEAQQAATPVETSAKIDATTEADAGAASGEPARMDRFDADASAAARDTRDADEQRFAEQTWSGP